MALVVPLAIKVHKVRRDRLVQLAPLDALEKKVIQESQVRSVCVDQSDHQEPQAHVVLQVSLVRRDKKGKMARSDQLDLRDRQDLREFVDWLDLLVDLDLL